MRSDPTSGLAQALAAQRAIAHQTVTLLVFLAACAAWRIAPVHEPQPLIDVLLVLGGIVLSVDLAAGWLKHEQTWTYADELILAGFSGTTRRTAIDRVVAHRLSWIESPRSRRRLARDLRWRLRLASGATHPSPGYIRASTFPPLAPYERRVLIDEEELILKMADRIEREPVDPRGLVILWSILCSPPSLGADTDRRAGDELRHRLRTAATMVFGGASKSTGDDR